MTIKLSQLKTSWAALAANFLALVFCSTGLASSTPDYYHCTNKVSGEYNFGRAPMACDGSSFGDDRLVQADFSPLVFGDGSERVQERARYSQEMFSALKEAATHYIQTRKPNVSGAELAAWVNAVQVTAAHESYWSHYRFASDAKLKLMRGDLGHGHGLMQIDDRAHFNAVTSGTAWNLIGNVIAGLDILYPFWVKAPAHSCVGSESNFEARTRAAWAAYNGGSDSNLCRWTNPASRWAANDRNFFAALKARGFQKYVANPAQPSSLNIPCLMEKRENCPARGPATAAPPAQLTPGVLYQTAEGQSCVINSGHAFCVDQVRDAICLNSITGVTGKSSVQIETARLAPYLPANLDRHRLCKSYDPTLLAVGSKLVTQKILTLRSTPGGGILSTVPAGQVLDILDFEVRNAPLNDRYYKVKTSGQEGFLYGGTAGDCQQWVFAAPLSKSPSLGLAQAGERLQVVNAAGINLRQTATGTPIGRLQLGTVVEVLAAEVLGSDNSVHYKVQVNGQEGFVYAGLLQPFDTTSQWMKRLP